jgi:hypothetical protein
MRVVEPPVPESHRSRDFRLPLYIGQGWLYDAGAMLSLYSFLRQLICQLVALDFAVPRHPFDARFAPVLLRSALEL